MTAGPPSARLLLDWYDRHARRLPWRAIPPAPPDPYRIWLSEIMLQQTTVAAVRPYYARFLERFPTLLSLAAASEPELLPHWAGLGYYARGRNLLAAAKAIAAAGAFPRTVDALEALPGIGRYTARALAAIAFGVPVVPVDGNVERVTARLFAIEAPLPAARPAIAAAAATLNAEPEAQARPSDFAQALFDLGATICTPRNPACALCPWRTACVAHAAGTERALPRKSPKAARTVRHGVVFVRIDQQARIWLRRRGPTGLFAGMTECPGTPLQAEPWTLAEAMAHAPTGGDDWQELGDVRHGLTHLDLVLRVLGCRGAAVVSPGLDGDFLVSVDELRGEALSGLMRKCVDLALAAADPGRCPAPRQEPGAPGPPFDGAGG